MDRHLRHRYVQGGLMPTEQQTTRRRHYLPLLQRLLSIRRPTLEETLNEASTKIAAAFQADKVDCFIHHAATDMLVALGTSETPLGRRQQALGLDRLPVQRGGRAATVFLSAQPFVTGAAHQDPDELPEIITELGIRSTIAVPLMAEERVDGVLSVTSRDESQYGRADMELLESISYWIQLLRQRQQLLDQVRAAPARAPLSTPDATIAELTEECRHLRGEVRFWQSAADELMQELHRWQMRANGPR
jgi:GAF domain-containing protein